MPTPRARVSTRIRRTSHRQGPRAPEHLVERMVVMAIGVVQAYTDRLMRALEPLLQERYGVRHDSLRLDAAHSSDEVFANVREGEMSKPFLERMFHMVDQQAANDLQRVVPVTLSDVLPRAVELQRAWVEKNTQLIRLEERAQKEVRAIIEAPIVEGVRVEEIRARIQERMGVVQSRAELIARDQTLKLYGQVQEERQTEAGIVEYTWSGSLDEREREEHLLLEGTTQRWDTPPVVDRRTGRREHPGGDFQCRCAAIPILPTGDEPPISETRPSRRPGQLQSVAPLPPEEQALAAPIPDPVEQEHRRLAEERAAREAERERLAAERAAAEAEARAEAERQRVLEAQAEARAEAERQRVLEAQAEARRVEAARLAEERAAAEARERVRKIVPNLDVEHHPLADTAVKALEEAGFADLFKAGELKELQLARKAILHDGESIAGIYERPIGQALPEGHPRRRGAGLRVDLSPETLREFTDDHRPLGDKDLWTIANAAKTETELIGSVVTHEFGHAVQLKDDLIGSPLWAKIESIVFAAGRADPAHEAKDWLSSYASSSREEYFAEAFTAYRLHPVWMREHAPRALRMVEDVLKLRGMK